jgi:hypothetical protein
MRGIDFVLDLSQRLIIIGCQLSDNPTAMDYTEHNSTLSVVPVSDMVVFTESGREYFDDSHPAGNSLQMP